MTAPPDPTADAQDAEPMSRRDAAPATPGLFDAESFAGFGPSRFRAAAEPVLCRRVRRGTHGEARLWQKVRDEAPRGSGVYGMLDRNGRVIYIGKAKSLRMRLLSYFRKNSRDPKAGKILDHTRTLCWEQTPDEFGALLRELELVRRFRPRFNVLLMPGPRRYVYLCLGKKPAPYAYLAREPGGKDVAVYGPLVGRSFAFDAVRRLNDLFGLRDCPSAGHKVLFRDQIELFPEDRGAKCLRYDIGTCRGPCGGMCSKQEYAAGVRAARAFLDGADRKPLELLARQMAAAAAELKFEQAMSLRDRLQSLTWLSDRLSFLRSARRNNCFVYPLRTDAGRALWYLIHHGEVQAAVREPLTPDECAAAAALIEKTFARSAPPEGIDSKCVDSVLLVTGWFKRYRDEKPKLLRPEQALALCAERLRPPGSPATSSPGLLVP